MSEIDKIVADERVMMTETLIRAFRAEGCNPGCHCCSEYILKGSYFKLAQVAGNDEMLCDDCTPKKLLKKRKKERAEREFQARGFTRKHIN